MLIMLHASHAHVQKSKQLQRTSDPLDLRSQSSSARAFGKQSLRQTLWTSVSHRMFEKSLTDLIRGIRANKKNEQKYIAVCLQEIRNEVKSNDPDIKAMAVAKLTYVSADGLLLVSLPTYLTQCSCKCLAMTCPGPHSTLSKSCPVQSSCTSVPVISLQPSRFNRIRTF